MSQTRSDTGHMSTADQTLTSALHGEALLMTKRPELRPLIDHLREQAQGRDDIRTSCAGVIAGAWQRALRPTAVTVEISMMDLEVDDPRVVAAAEEYARFLGRELDLRSATVEW